MNRDYAKVKPEFWSCKTLREAGGEAQRMALYLLTNYWSRSTGLYRLPLPMLLAELSMSPRKARETLRLLAQLKFAEYDEAEELAWVPQIASDTYGETLKPNDGNVVRVARLVNEFKDHPFAREFYGLYGDRFNLPPAPWQVDSQDAPQEDPFRGSRRGILPPTVDSRPSPRPRQDRSDGSGPA